MGRLKWGIPDQAALPIAWDAVICPNCGHDNPTDARFCGACGSPLAAVSDTALPPSAVSLAAATYAGFWVRLAAWTIDAVITNIGSSFVFAALGGGDLRPILFLLLPALYFVLLTGLKGQTLGKMAAGIRVVNREGLAPGVGRAALRETVGKFVSAIALLLGFLWVARDPEKQGWHDKMAGTYVVTVRR